MAGDAEPLLGPARLREVRDFWLEHLAGPDALVLPSQADHARWFAGGEELDRACVERFGPTLDAIRRCGFGSGAEVLEAARPREAADWLGLVLLLDQVPRNCYRGATAAVVFDVFDPLARAVALAALGRGLPEADAATRWRLALRPWFYLPLMHSEDPALHRRATEAYEGLRRDVYALADAAAGGDAHGHEHGHGGGGDGDMYLDFEMRHRAVVDRFGRYPHRNQALGRASTDAEAAYLAAGGGETFGSVSQPAAA